MDQAGDDRNIVLRWRFDRTDIMDYHLAVQVDGGSAQYLGRPGRGDVDYYEWKAGQRWLSPKFADGPEDGHSYRFLIWVLPMEGPFFPPVFTGEVDYFYSEGPHPGVTGKRLSPGRIEAEPVILPVPTPTVTPIPETDNR